MKPPALGSRPLSLAVLSLSALMGGCAVSPLVSWTPPSYPTDGAVSMNFAMRYARSARDAYRTRLQDQVQNQGQLSASLLGIGALATGAAAAHMHRDVYAGLAFAGATSYAYGQQTLRPERLRVYLAGIEAMDCAIAVVSPLDMSEKDATELHRQTLALLDALASQGSAMSALQAFVPAKGSGPDIDDWRRLLSASDDLQSAARATADAGRDAGGKVKQAALALMNSVDRVRTEMDKAAIETLPSLDSIGQAIAGLPDLAGRILPGANLDQRIRKAVGSTSKAAGAAESHQDQPGRSPLLTGGREARAALVQANLDLAKAAGRVSALLAGVVANTSTAGLAQCKVAGVVAPLSVTKTELRFAGGKEETQSFVVRGGVPPYAASLMTGGATGVTVRNPVGNDTRIDVTVAASASAASYELLVEDRANSGANSVTVAIQVGSSSGPAATDAAGGGAAKLEDLRKAIEAVAPFTTKSGHQFSQPVTVPGSDGSLLTQLSCAAKAGKAPDTEAEVREQLLKSAGQTEAYKELFGTQGKTFELTAQPAGCMVAKP